MGALELTQLTKSPQKLAENEGENNGPEDEQKDLKENPDPTVYDYTAKVTFLSPKQAWLFFSKPELRQER